MELVAIVIALALLEYVAFGMLVGKARVTYGVKAPATSGHEIFDRYFRVHQNTLEMMVVFVPATWLFGQYVSANWGAALGAVFIAGRIIYLRSYIADPAKRGTGFGLSFLPIAVMLIGILVAAGMKLLA
jgi:uncharacterized MAPEG superfamily protein